MVECFYESQIEVENVFIFWWSAIIAYNSSFYNFLEMVENIFESQIEVEKVFIFWWSLSKSFLQLTD